MAIVEVARRRSTRAPSPRAVAAARDFNELATFFATRSQLRQALGWSAPTVRQWLGSDLPARPRSESVRVVINLLEVCRAASRWVSDRHRVGEWAVAPQPEFDGVAPAVLVQRLGGEAVRALVDNMVRIAPREHVAPEPPDLSVEGLRSTLASLATPAIAPAAPVAVDLSDFDDQPRQRRRSP
jgi:hypothetical protein